MVTAQARWLAGRGWEEPDDLVGEVIDLCLAADDPELAAIVARGLSRTERREVATLLDAFGISEMERIVFPKKGRNHD